MLSVTVFVLNMTVGIHSYLIFSQCNLSPILRNGMYLELASEFFPWQGI